MSGYKNLWNAVCETINSVAPNTQTNSSVYQQLHCQTNLYFDVFCSRCKTQQIWRRADTYQRWGQTMCSGWDRVCVPTSSLTECDEARSSNDSTSSRLQHTRRDTDESVIQITNQSSTLLDHSLLLKKLTQLTERKWDGKRGHKIMLNEYYLIIYLLTYFLQISPRLTKVKVL